MYVVCIIGRSYLVIGILLAVIIIKMMSIFEKHSCLYHSFNIVLRYLENACHVTSHYLRKTRVKRPIKGKPSEASHSAQKNGIVDVT